ncbi:hypothetical protein N7456_000934 [Penicillium angulare]|uniref:Uncharacterized protein n=1 Tax=Penicillium angulare TaxID=116970 RepID=A0A9W9GDG3_9EURO|nr:hypothetical protein N7456_000934 [Penicillium angulare]
MAAVDASNPLNLDLGDPHELCETEEVIFSLLTRYLPETSSITPNEAAEQVNAFVLEVSQRPSPLEGKQEVSNFLLMFWELMFRLAQQLDYRHEPMQRFIALIKALRNLPETAFIEQPGPGAPYDGQPAWRSKCYYTMMLTERWHPENPEYKSPEDLWDFRWRNMNGLLAHFTHHNLDTYGYEKNGISVIIRALEEYRRKKPVSPINRRVPAAAIWFVLCSSIIYSACQRQGFPNIGPGKFWKGEPQQGLSIARWNFWKKRFGELEGHPDATELTKEACRAAIEEMDKYPSDVE